MYGLEDGGIPATFFVHYMIGWKPHESQVSLTWTFDGILSVWLQVQRVAKEKKRGPNVLTYFIFSKRQQNVDLQQQVLVTYQV